MFLRGAQQIDREEAAERLKQDWMAANLDGDAIKDAVKSMKGN